MPKANPPSAFRCLLYTPPPASNKFTTRSGRLQGRRGLWI